MQFEVLGRAGVAGTERRDCRGEIANYCLRGCRLHLQARLAAESDGAAGGRVSRICAWRNLPRRPGLYDLGRGLGALLQHQALADRTDEIVHCAVDGVYEVAMGTHRRVS